MDKSYVACIVDDVTAVLAFANNVLLDTVKDEATVALLFLSWVTDLLEVVAINPSLEVSTRVLNKVLFGRMLGFGLSDVAAMVWKTDVSEAWIVVVVPLDFILELIIDVGAKVRPREDKLNDEETVGTTSGTELVTSMDESPLPEWTTTVVDEFESVTEPMDRVCETLGVAAVDDDADVAAGELSVLSVMDERLDSLAE